MLKPFSRVGPLLFLLSLGVLCILGFFAVNFISGIPGEVEQTFGPASSTLSNNQKLNLSIRLWLQKDALFTPVNPIGGEQSFSIGLDESVTSILSNLASQGLINDTTALRNYLIYAGLDTQLQAGEYTLSPNMPPILIAHALLDATPELIILTVFPGWRLEEIADSLPTSGLTITPQEFIAATFIRPPGYSFTTDLPFGASVEGFLYPGVYEVQRDITADQLVILLLNSFEENVGFEIHEGFSRQGLSLYEGVILASIVQREAVLVEEQPQIASVFLNRLNISMKLETDPTVQYALAYNQDQLTWWTNPLSLTDLEFVSPFNTYIYPGLPPGPIANPGLDALQAVAFPAVTPYFYFRAACDGSGRHIFAETFEQHQANACG
ncbi:MAG: endolytic transglycosylase MltG [Chloroflexi bacterium]|nr:endolytic transglycosylase MltG [Chloroflexota bacterium]